MLGIRKIFNLNEIVVGNDGKLQSVLSNRAIDILTSEMEFTITDLFVI